MEGNKQANRHTVDSGHHHIAIHANLNIFQLATRTGHHRTEFTYALLIKQIEMIERVSEKEGERDQIGTTIQM